jgi:hypothetical protein
MKPAEIYRKAAKLLEDGALHSGDDETKVKFSCCAVAEAEGIFPAWNYGHKSSRLVDGYREVFDGDFEWDEDHRIVALCMMAAMVEKP